jgi:hypothetical protein
MFAHQNPPFERKMFQERIRSTDLTYTPVHSTRKSDFTATLLQSACRDIVSSAQAHSH